MSGASSDQHVPLRGVNQLPASQRGTSSDLKADFQTM